MGHLVGYNTNTLIFEEHCPHYLQYIVNRIKIVSFIAILRENNRTGHASPDEREDDGL